ncbi:MAG: hypothetical protein ABSF14_19935 [Terriglobia bacterium]|jgi:hypothetical protein
MPLYRRHFKPGPLQLNIMSMPGAGACVHGNPLKRGLVSSPDPWPWSSFRVYHLNDFSVLSTDRLV